MDSRRGWMMRRANGWTRKLTGETPFSMTYGAKVVIPLETGFPTLRTSLFAQTAMTTY